MEIIKLIAELAKQGITVSFLPGIMKSTVEIRASKDNQFSSLNLSLEEFASMPEKVIAFAINRCSTKLTAASVPVILPVSALASGSNAP